MQQTVTYTLIVTWRSAMWLLMCGTLLTYTAVLSAEMSFFRALDCCYVSKLLTSLLIVISSTASLLAVTAVNSLTGQPICRQNYIASIFCCISVQCSYMNSLPYLITDRRVLELIPVLGSQPAGDVSHKPGGRLLLLSAKPAVTLATLKRATTNFIAWWTEAQWVWTVCLILLPSSVTNCDLNQCSSAPESITLTSE